MKQLQGDYKRIVVKIGASLFYDRTNRLVFDNFNALAKQIVDLNKIGKEIIVVSSGAIALGMPILGLKERPKALYNLQAAAAIGQNEVINSYRNIFRSAGCHGAQILLTWEDFNDRKRYLNAKYTILALIRYGAVPIINENDTVSTEEIKFGDNDRLSALVASLISADLLIILSDVDGLLDKDKKVIKLVPEINAQIKSLAYPTNKKTCVGGMVTKVEAAKMAVDSGIPCVIANGRAKNIIFNVIRNPLAGGLWTVFLPKKALRAREHWIAFGAKSKGAIIVDDGAKRALLDRKSLLSVGIVAIEGDFMPADIVSIKDKNGEEFARGKVRLSSNELEKVKGIRFSKEIIHRNDMVML